MSNNPYSVSSIGAPNQSPYADQAQVHPMEPLYQATGWLTLLGWVFIVVGVIQCLTIIGAVIGWLPIWMGVVLKRASDQIKYGFSVGDNNSLNQASKDLRTYFTITGVLTLIGIAFNVIYIGVFVLLLIGGLVGASVG